jgi:hypothetical protein
MLQPRHRPTYLRIHLKEQYARRVHLESQHQEAERSMKWQSIRKSRDNPAEFERRTLLRSKQLRTRLKREAIEFITGTNIRSMVRRRKLQPRFMCYKMGILAVGIVVCYWKRSKCCSY